MQFTDRKRPCTVRTDREMHNTDRYSAGVLDNPLENYIRFQTKIGKAYTRFQTKTAQKPYPMGRHIPI